MYSVAMNDMGTLLATGSTDKVCDRPSYLPYDSVCSGSAALGSQDGEKATETYGP